MKKIIASLAFVFISVAVFAQSGTKVKWDFIVKKIGDKKYEVRMIANIQPGWHLYSQHKVPMRLHCQQPSALLKIR
jgi:thiol:disulfide interchange protein DsbD